MADRLDHAFATLMHYGVRPEDFDDVAPELAEGSEVDPFTPSDDAPLGDGWREWCQPLSPRMVLA